MLGVYLVSIVVNKYAWQAHTIQVWQQIDPHNETEDHLSTAFERNWCLQQVPLPSWYLLNLPTERKKDIGVKPYPVIQGVYANHQLWFIKSAPVTVQFSLSGGTSLDGRPERNKK